MYHPQNHTDTRRRRRLAARAGQLAVAGACLIGLPATAIAAPATLHKTYQVKVNRNVLAKGNTVKVNTTVSAPVRKVSSWWSKKTVTAVVKKGVNNESQSPYFSNGFHCTPTVNGPTKANFTCKLRGADVATTVTLKFSVVYRGNTTLRKTYTVTVKRNVLAKGNTVKATATVSEPDPRVSSWWSTKTVTAVVRKGVNGAFEEPYTSQGYRCTPTLRGKTTSFTCKLRGADVPTSVTLKYQVVYRSSSSAMSFI